MMIAESSKLYNDNSLSEIIDLHIMTEYNVYLILYECKKIEKTTCGYNLTKLASALKADDREKNWRK